MKKIFWTLLLLLTTSLVYAVPAKPRQTKLLQLTDGTTVAATLVGDEHGHYWLATDGKAYQSVSGSDVFQPIDLQQFRQKAQQRRAKSNARRTRRLAPRRAGETGSITGQKKGLIILVNFSDLTFMSANNKALYQRIANEENFSYNNFKGSMYDYFKAQSEGQFELTFDIVGPVTVEKTQSYYGQNDSGGNDKYPAKMVIEALKLADSEVNYANYDWDDDGEVEQVYVVYAGKGEADGGESYTIWSHEYALSSAKLYGDGTGAQTLDGVKIDTYACGSELEGESGTIAGIGTMCHEFSHCLGYPDFYDTDYSGGQGMFEWDLMDSGSYNGGGFRPAGYTSYERWVAGWKEPIELTTTQTISNVKALQNGGDSYVIYNKGNSNEYYLLENRQKVGWDTDIPGAGLLIIHVDYDADVWAKNEPNDDASHQRMTWIAADNKYQYTTYQGTKYYTTAGAANDPFPYGNVNAFGKNTTPAAKLYNKNIDNTYYLDSSVENITQNTDGTVSFEFKADDSSGDDTGGGNTGGDEQNENTLLYESLSGYSSNNDGTFSLNTDNVNLDYKGWSTLTKIYAGGTSNAHSNGGCLKFGSGSAIGSMTTGNIALTGAGTLTFYLKKYGSDTGTLNVTVDGATADVKQFTPESNWTLCTVNLTEATGNVIITLSTSSKRAYVDEIRLVSDPVDPTTAYYAQADGKKGAELKTAMCGIIYNRTEQSYDDLWTAFQTTDVRSDGKIWDMYSNITNYTPVTTGSTYSTEGDCYNREHSFPQSWFGSSVPMNTDLHHIYPTDGFVNGKRANYPFGETNGNSYKSANDFSKLGTCTYPGYNGTVFEPADEYKGDFARTYFYIVTCYEEKLADWYNQYSDAKPTLDGNPYPGLSSWQLAMLMKWAKNDPVSEKETARNAAVYAIQNNRNPFIDYPGLEEYIWGSMTDNAFSYDNYVGPTYDDTTPDDPTPVEPAENTYKLVESMDQMVSGARYIIACGDKGTAAGSLNKTYLNAVDATVNDGVIQANDQVMVFTVTTDGSHCTIVNENGQYLYSSAAKSVGFGDSEFTWELEKGQNGVIIKYDSYTLQYNASSPRFTTYTSSQTEAYLYMEFLPTYELADASNQNGTLIESKAGKRCNVKLTGRTLYKDDSWNTLCLPFDVTIAGSPLAGATVKTLTAASMNGKEVSLTFSDVTGTLNAGVPYIIKWEQGADIEEPTFTNVTIVEKDEAQRTIEQANGHVKFIGYYDTFDITADNDDIYYMTSDNTLKYTTKQRTMKACRAYFQFTANDAQGHVKDFAFSLDFDGNETTIQDSSFTLHNAADAWYDLSGRRVNSKQLPRGIYIVNGKKVIIK